ncbi:MAG TPA: peptidoglycan-binding domain-containing protein [Mesorhizobium sp.]|jgi:hypothetical protein|nr:peptidoglycan-binding domain-containing protein [Mesorhizobium sp.]
MAWRLARSLETLRAQINALSPNRSKVSDGTIGDTAHSSRKSEHNPDSKGRVRALDLTHDPAHGVDGRKLADALLASRDPRILYIISNGEIVSGAGGPKPWAWRPYQGKNPHRHHVHISAVDGAAADDTSPWQISLDVPALAAARPIEVPRNPVLVIGNKGPDVERLQRLLSAIGHEVVPDAHFGPRTEAAVKAFQRARKLVVDGSVGPQTWEALGA